MRAAAPHSERRRCQTCAVLALYRPHIFTTFTSFKAAWREQPRFATTLLGNLAADFQAAARDLGPDPEPGGLRRLLSLANCIAAVAQACGPDQAACIRGMLLLTAFSVGYTFMHHHVWIEQHDMAVSGLGHAVTDAQYRQVWCLRKGIMCNQE